MQLPELCIFQTVNYTIIIRDDNDDIVDKWTREFSYSSGYNSECIEEVVNKELGEGREYSVQITIDGGVNGNASFSASTSFSEFLT